MKQCRVRQCGSAVRRAAALTAGLALLGAACASGGGGRGGSAIAPARLDDGVLALSRGDFAAARERLRNTREICGDLLLGRQALLLLAALELDPRNPDRSPDRAAEHAAAYLHLPETFPWTRPFAESLYLLALDFGAREEEFHVDRVSPGPDAVGACDEADGQAVAAAVAELPELTAPSVPARLRALERKRADLRRELAQLQGELQRVRATVRP